MDEHRTSELVSEYLADWINGNRQDVMKNIGRQPPHQAALVGALVYASLSKPDQEIFVKMLMNRMA